MKSSTPSPSKSAVATPYQTESVQHPPASPPPELIAVIRSSKKTLVVVKRDEILDRGARASAHQTKSHSRFRDGFCAVLESDSNSSTDE